MIQDDVNRIFNVLRKANNAHWKAPKVDDINSAIEKNNKFIFILGKKPIVATITFTKNSVTYTVNTDLPKRMLQDAVQRKKKFYELLLATNENNE